MFRHLKCTYDFGVRLNQKIEMIGVYSVFYTKWFIYFHHILRVKALNFSFWCDMFLYIWWDFKHYKLYAKDQV